MIIKDIKVIDILQDGRGVGKADSKVYFIEGASFGETCDIEKINATTIEISIVTIITILIVFAIRFIVVSFLALSEPTKIMPIGDEEESDVTGT